MATVPHDLEEFAPDDVPVLVVEAAPQSRGSRAVRVLMGFLLGQASAQGISVLAALYLVRTLSVEAYAQFGVAIAFQGVFSVLMDLGFAGTIIPLVGDRRDDPLVVGRYVRAAKHLRDRAFWIFAPIAALTLLGIMHRHHWSWTIQLFLLASTLVSLYSGGQFSIFSTPLFLFGRLREYYLPQVVSGIGRVLAYLLLAFFGGLNACTAAALGALNVTVNGWLVRRASRELLTWPPQEHKDTHRELFRYILPASPAIVFSAFQAQISVFLVSIFGGTLNIAEVAALSRIGQLFAVLVTFNVIVVEPYIARHSSRHLARTFFTFILLTCLACIPVCLVAAFRPGVFLFLIGSKYHAIEALMGWYVLGAALNFVANLIWIMNRARRWVFWSGSVVEIVLLLAVQTAFLIAFGVSNTRQAVFFNLASSVCYLVAHGYVSILGFTRDARTLQAPA